MRRQPRPRTKSIERKDEQASAPPVEPMVNRQSRDESPPEVEPPRESQESISVQEREMERQPEDQGTGLEAEFQKLSITKTGGKKGDGLDVKEDFVATPEYTQVPEAGEGQPEV